MNILLFFVFWIVFTLGVPMILHALFGSTEYPLVSIGVVIGFVGGALLSALITGLFKAERPPQSK
jgi:energy-converting hydrogenase Eha subunit A